MTMEDLADISESQIPYYIGIFLLKISHLRFRNNFPVLRSIDIAIQEKI